MFVYCLWEWDSDFLIWALYMEGKFHRTKKKEEIKKDTILLKEDLKFEINSEVNLLSMVSEENKDQSIKRGRKNRHIYSRGKRNHYQI